MSSATDRTAGPAAGLVLIPPVVFGLAAVGQRLMARRKRRRQEAAPGSDECRPTQRCRGGRRVLSVGVSAASVGLLAAAASELTEAGTTLDARDPAQASALVTSGVFARTRNPLYLGLTGLLVAHSLWLGARRALVPAGAFVLVMDRLQIPAEEAALAEKFGKAYRVYTEQVPRWLL